MFAWSVMGCKKLVSGLSALVPWYLLLSMTGKPSAESGLCMRLLGFYFVNGIHLSLRNILMVLVRISNIMFHVIRVRFFIRELKDTP